MVTLLLATLCAQAWAATFPTNATPVTNTEEDPFRVVLNSSVDYQLRWLDPAQSPDKRLRLGLEPLVAFGHMSATIDLEKKGLPQAELTAARLWILSVLSYRRNVDASVSHDLQLLGALVPLWSFSLGEESAFTTVVFAGGANLGHRWLESGERGAYLEPAGSVLVSSTLSNRVFAVAYARASAAAVFGMPDYLSGAAGAKLGVALIANNLVRLTGSGNYRFYGANAHIGTEPLERYFVVGIEWGEPTPLLYSTFGTGPR